MVAGQRPTSSTSTPPLSTHIVVPHMDLRLERGGVLAVLGPSGSGKTWAIREMDLPRVTHIWIGDLDPSSLMGAKIRDTTRTDDLIVILHEMNVTRDQDALEDLVRWRHRTTVVFAANRFPAPLADHVTTVLECHHPGKRTIRAPKRIDPVFGIEQVEGNLRPAVQASAAAQARAM